MFRLGRKKIKLSTCHLTILLICILLYAKVSFSASTISEIIGENSKALVDDATQSRFLVRLKRQQTLGSNQQQGASSVSASLGQGASGSVASGLQDTQGSNNVGPDGERPPDEVLSSFKCDFGTADAPDLCKLKILESTNPLSKGLANWSLGSGKLALYQGGPLIDASDRNDTTGGYIFYETSNPFANGLPGATTATNHTSIINNHPYELPARASQSMGGQRESPYTNEYVSSQAYTVKANHRNEHPTTSDYNNHQPNYNNNDNTSHFQQVTSSRMLVGNSNAGINNPSPSFLSPNLTAPGPSGMCLSFQYAIQGLSAEELRIHVNDHKTERSRQIWASSESGPGGNWTRGEVLYSVTNVHSLMFSASSSMSMSKDLLQRKFRGHIALDEIEISRHDPASGGGDGGPCRGHCNFDGDLCGWTNAENGPEDDFDWSFGRGSENLFTGPARDFVSSNNNELTGSYLHTDSGYPRRPGDRATLISPMFQPTAVNDAMCMRFAVHMFGSGIGSLAIKIRYADDSGGQQTAAAVAAGPGIAANPSGVQLQSASRSSDGKQNNDLVIWEMSGDAGNSWHQAQTSVSSSKSPFQVIIEGVIGENHLGNIAIDEISFSPGPCPTSPPVASKNYGDCTFEQTMCYWRNPDADIHLDDLDWVRSADEQTIHGPNFDHTLKKRSGSYLKLENTFREPKSGTRAFLLSPIFQPKVQGNVQCLSFYYYMFMRSISSSGPNLGTIRVYLASNNELVPIWRLTNPISSPNWKHGRASLSTALIDGQPTAPKKLFQIAFEGIWGDAASGAIALDDITVFDGACDIMPPEAKSVPGECTFDVDMCSWSNKTSELLSNEAIDSTDNSRSPFLQSVNSASGGHLSSSRAAMQATGSGASKRLMSWQQATVDSRPVNLQDHTYKAPIGYVYVDVLDGSQSQPMAFVLQSADVTVQSGVQIAQCLSFWYVGFGRQDTNQLSVYLTQASAPPPSPDDSGNSGSAPSQARAAQLGSGNLNQFSGASSSSSTGGSVGGSSNSNQGNQQSGSSAVNQANSAVSSATSNSAGGSDSEGENPTAWRFFNGKLLWSMSLKNITELQRRKWQYGQVALKADSNYIVRFVALSNDGGFALDDISYYEGACETRPALAKVVSEEDDSSASSQPTATQPKA